MAVSLESQALVSKQHELVTTIQHSVTTIADKCLGKGLISQETSSKISEINSINLDKARLLLENLKATVIGTPTSLSTFITILEEEKSHKNIVEILTNEVQALKNRTEAKLSSGHSSKETGFVATTVPCVEERQQLSSCKRKSPGHIDYALKDLGNVMEKLQFAKLDETETKAKLTAAKQELKDVKEEKAESEKEKRLLNETIEDLKKTIGDLTETIEGVKREKDEAVKRIAKAQKKNYEDIKEKEQLTEQLSVSCKNISGMTEQIEKLLTKQQTMEQDLHEMENFRKEADADLQEFDMLEAKYENMCQQVQDVMKELRQEKNIALLMYNMSEDQRIKTEARHRYAYCFIIAVVLIFAVVICVFSYCLEDEANHNIKQCTQTAINIAVEYALGIGIK